MAAYFHILSPKITNKNQNYDEPIATVTHTPFPHKVLHNLIKAWLGIGAKHIPLFLEDVDNRHNLLIVDVGACDGEEWAIPAVKNSGHTVVAFEPVNTGRFRMKVIERGLNDSLTKVKVPIGSPPFL